MELLQNLTDIITSEFIKTAFADKDPEVVKQIIVSIQLAEYNTENRKDTDKNICVLSV